jgi:hypothetical protein
MNHRLGCPAQGLYALAADPCACGAEDYNALARRVARAAEWQREQGKREALLADLWGDEPRVAAYHADASVKHIDTAELLEEATIPEEPPDASTMIVLERSLLQEAVLAMNLARAYLNTRHTMKLPQVVLWDALVTRMTSLLGEEPKVVAPPPPPIKRRGRGELVRVQRELGNAK